MIERQEEIIEEGTTVDQVEIPTAVEQIASVLQNEEERVHTEHGTDSGEGMDTEVGLEGECLRRNGKSSMRWA